MEAKTYSAHCVSYAISMLRPCFVMPARTNSSLSQAHVPSQGKLRRFTRLHKQLHCNTFLIELITQHSCTNSIASSPTTRRHGFARILDPLTLLILRICCKIIFAHFNFMVRTDHKITLILPIYNVKYNPCTLYMALEMCICYQNRSV